MHNRIYGYYGTSRSVIERIVISEGNELENDPLTRAAQMKYRCSSGGLFAVSFWFCRFRIKLNMF